MHGSVSRGARRGWGTGRQGRPGGASGWRLRRLSIQLLPAKPSRHFFRSLFFWGPPEAGEASKAVCRPGWHDISSIGFLVGTISSATSAGAPGPHQQPAASPAPARPPGPAPSARSCPADPAPAPPVASRPPSGGPAPPPPASCCTRRPRRPGPACPARRRSGPAHRLAGPKTCQRRWHAAALGPPPAARRGWRRPRAAAVVLPLLLRACQAFDGAPDGLDVWATRRVLEPWKAPDHLSADLYRRRGKWRLAFPSRARDLLLSWRMEPP